MTDPKERGTTLSRREALKQLGIATTGAALIPTVWNTPLVEASMLPPHAQVSAASPFVYPFNNTVQTTVTRSGTPVPSVSTFEDRGWVGVYVPPGVAKGTGVDDGGLEAMMAKGKRPWRRLRRKFNLGPPGWAFGLILVTIRIRFQSLIPGKPKKRPKGKLNMFMYGRDNGNVNQANQETDIEDGEAVFLVFLPVGFAGFFFFSCFFGPFIELEDKSNDDDQGDDDDDDDGPDNTKDGFLDSSFYFGPCLYGDSSPYADDDSEDDIDDDIDDPEETQVGSGKITFQGVTINGNNSTWRYRVEETSAPPELAKLKLGLPLLDCAQFVSATQGGTAVQDGVEWTVAPAFTDGTFEIELTGNVATGLVDIEVEDSNANKFTGQITGPICETSSDAVELANCFRISFKGATDNGNGTSTWTYTVEEQPCAQDLSNWVLELPTTCGQIVSATPNPWEPVQPDPNTNITGIKWQTGAGFENGDFSVTLQGALDTDLVIGKVKVAAKGPGVAQDEISGPVCKA